LISRGLKQKPSVSEKTVNGSWKDIALSGLSQMNSFQKRNGFTGVLLRSEGFIAVSVLKTSGIQRYIEINDLIKCFPPFFSDDIVPPLMPLEDHSRIGEFFYME
jgi:hypothetical protein